MKHMIKIVIISLCAALVLSSCNKDNHTPDSPDHKTLIGFSALSQNVMVKNGATSTSNSFSDYHADFGVWGIARDPNIANPYVLWKPNAMTKVEKPADSDDYIPVDDAFWLKGYTYNFLALAPYASGVSNFNITRATGNQKDQMSFQYNMGAKYAAGENKDYDFSLLAAAAENADATVSRTGSQQLTFWNLLSRLSIKYAFEGEYAETAELTQMRLVNVDSHADYTVSLNSGNTLNVAVAAPATGNSDLNLTVHFAPDDFVDGTEGTADAGLKVTTVHVLPQDISGWKLYLDFNITKDGQIVSTTNYEIDLTNARAALTANKFQFNYWYKWKIGISPSLVSFEVDVNPWQNGGDFPFDIQ